MICIQMEQRNETLTSVSRKLNKDNQELLVLQGGLVQEAEV